ncbi:hypothetical protein Tco_0570051, partial [Tanacetum coccineum]
KEFKICSLGSTEKILLVHAHESGKVLDEERLEVLADPGVLEGQETQTTMPHNAAFQTDDLDAFDSDCDEAPSAKAVLMANLSRYDSDVISRENESLTTTIDVLKKETKQKKMNTLKRL